MAVNSNRSQISYTTTGEVIKNQITPQKHGYLVDLQLSPAEDEPSPAHSTDLSESPKQFHFILAKRDIRWKDWFSKVLSLESIAKPMHTWWLMRIT
jgi:hypothetical protein